MSKAPTSPENAIASPAATGPAGPLFEGQVGAYYLLSMLAGGEPRGLPGTSITQVEFQRALERPLDDVIVKAVDAQGNPAILEIQVKRTVDFTASDDVFRAIVAQVAQAVVNPEFDTLRYELAVATERTSTKIERSYQEVLSWARELGTSEVFFKRLNQKKLSNSDMRKFVDNFRANLKLANAAADDAAVWHILRRFQILVFDFNQAGSSTETLVRERCASLLAPEEAAKASSLWETLTAHALASAANGGEKTTLQFRDKLANEYHYRFTGERRLANARTALQDASLGALQDISTFVGSVQVDRAAHIKSFFASMDMGRYIEIKGGPGTGKSAILKHVAAQIGQEARVIVLSPARTLPHGWISLRATLGCTVGPREFLSDLASDGGAVLFIDGVDTFDDEDKKVTVRDLVRAAASVPNFSVVVSARHNFGSNDDPSWLPADALNTLGRAPAVMVGDLNSDEIDQLAEGDPALAPLLADAHPAREVTRNLFRLARLAGRIAGTDVPASEAAMAQQWWASGDGSDVGRRERKRLLRSLAEQSLKSSGPFDTRTVPAEAVEALMNSATLRELKTEQVIFHHDVLHDWALGCLLHDDASFIDQLPLDRPATATLVRGIEIAARIAIEAVGDDTQWARLLDRLSRDGIHGSWRRAILLALVRSEIGLPVLDRVSERLYADGGKLLRELLRITFAVESKSGAQAYAAMGIELPLAVDFYVPAAPSWSRLVLWTHLQMDNIPKNVIPDLADFYSRWSIAMFGQDPFTPYLVGHFHAWLQETEAALHPEHFSGLRNAFGISMTYEQERGLESNLRLHFLAFCVRNPALAEQYLRSVIARKPGHPIADEIMKFRGTAAQAAPAALADLTLQTLIPVEDEDDYGSSRREHGPFGIGDTSFFPASPNQGPMLELLIHAPQEGLRVVRTLVSHAVNFYSGGREPGPNAITIRFPDGERLFAWQNCYTWSHNGGNAPAIATSALMAVEAWAHKRIEGGEAPAAVLADVLGPVETSTAFLLVAVDLLISHWPKTAEAALPFVSCPELLSVDRSRYAVDLVQTHISTKEPTGISSIKTLQDRASRRLSLDYLINLYVWGKSPLLPQLRSALAAASVRVGAPSPGDDSMRSIPFAAYHASNRAAPDNWKPVSIDQGDGTFAPGWQYKMPPEEEALTAPGHARLAANQIQTEMQVSLPLALRDSTRSTPELLSRALDWAKAVDLKTKPPEEEDDYFQSEDWRIRAKLTVAALVMRDGDEALRREHEAWAKEVFAEALSDQGDDRHSHPQLAYNNAAIAAVGQISAVRREPTEAGLRSLLELAGRSSRDMRPAFIDQLRQLEEIDARLPRALLRIALASCVHALRNYDESEEDHRQRTEVHRQRVLASIERELAWLRESGAEPEWPVFPNDPPRRKRYSRIGVSTVEWEEERKRPEDILDSNGAADWLQAALPLLGEDTMPWFRQLVEAYAEWISVEYGAGKEDDIETSASLTTWNMVYFDLAARTFVGMSAEEVSQGVLQRVLAFPEEPLFDTVSTLIRTSDELYFNDKTLQADEVIRLRTILFEKIRTTRGWRRVVEKKSTSMETHLARAMSTMFLHNDSWTGGKCYVNPVGAPTLKPLLPLLTDICVEAAESQYIALQFLDLIDLIIDPENLGSLVRAAGAWMNRYPDDTSFWSGYGVGTRLCTWFSSAMDSHPVAFGVPACPSTEIDRLLDGLLRVGIAAARGVEETFARIRKAP